MSAEILTIGDILRQPDCYPRLIHEPKAECNRIIEVTGVTSVGKDFLLGMTGYANNTINF